MLSHWVVEPYNELWRAIIRPPRDEYSLAHLGSPRFTLYGRQYERTDFQFRNRRGLIIHGSHFEPTHKPIRNLPCVIYSHGNSSSRVEAIACLPELLPLDITVVCFDFAGSGHSEGEYVSLGWFEKNDLAEVIDYVREERRASTVGLWGRSMGAVATLLQASRDSTISGVVCDSPFASLRRLSREVAHEFLSIKLPDIFFASAMSMIRSTVASKAGFDIDNLNVTESVTKVICPALFIVARNDSLIDPSHGRDLNKLMGGPSVLIEVEGDHNSLRPRAVTQCGALFLYEALHCDLLLEGTRTRSRRPRSWLNCARDLKLSIEFKNDQDEKENEYSLDT